MDPLILNTCVKTEHTPGIKLEVSCLKQESITAEFRAILGVCVRTWHRFAPAIRERTLLHVALPIPRAQRLLERLEEGTWSSRQAACCE